MGELNAVYTRLLSTVLFAGTVLACGGQTSPSPDGGGSGASTGGESGETPDDLSWTSGLSLMKVGTPLHRECGNYAMSVYDFPVAEMTCRLTQGVSIDVRANTSSKDTNGDDVFMTVHQISYIGLSPGDDKGGVSLGPACPGTSRSTPDPCEIELVEVVRGVVPEDSAPGYAVEKGSRVRMRVRCPETLVAPPDEYGEVRSSTFSPTEFAIEVSDCLFRVE